jgi:enterochelin esterase-like enzyme/outer membrane protein assembly factor BamB
MRQIRVVLAAAAAVTLVLPGGALGQEAADWPGFRGSAAGDVDARPGSLSGVDEMGLSVGWRRALGSGYSGIAVAGGRLVTAFSDGVSDFAVALDAASGAELWRYRIAPTYRGHDGSHDGPISTPVVSGGRAYGLGPRGDLFALALETGKPVWARSLAGPDEEPAPYYGFSTSPTLAGEVLVVGAALSGHRGISGFDAATGEPRWSLESDAINYQSPVRILVEGEAQLVVAGDEKLYGLDPERGDLLWEHAYGGDGRAMGSQSMNPVPAGENRLFLTHKIHESVLVEIRRTGDGFSVEPVWTSEAFGNSYAVPVYHDGHLYGYRGSILTCVDAATGERVWRSRPPGDGFLTLVDGHLLVATKVGGLHVARATPDGYREVGHLPLFDEGTWTPVSFAGGDVYARGFDAVARVELGSATGSGASRRATARPDSRFGRFLASLEDLPPDERPAAVSAFLEGVSSFPLVEQDGLVHFLYRGEADDMAIVGEMIGSRREDRMLRVPGTDLFHYSVRLEPGARVGYRFIRDLDETLLDPGNPRVSPGHENPAFWGELSWVTTPGWEPPDHLREPEGPRGRVASLELETAHFEDERQLSVYLPPGYDDGDARYPVVYLHEGPAAFEHGALATSLDNLVGKTVEPLIVVLVHPPGSPMGETWGPRRGAFLAMLVGEVVPLVDGRYRTRPEPASRAVAGVSASGVSALFAAFQHPDTFGAVAIQSLIALTEQEDELAALLAGAGDPPLRVYQDWGRYDLRGSVEGWDMAEANRRLAERLRARGYEPAGGEALDGHGWGSWQNRPDRLFETLFPLAGAQD